ncbi:MAG: murein biosynthesis integral membrane protein MurJ [Clostridia bacterium]|nr:murein biosynthesis integral membrane protein MurJ [Christensenellaceae bacterium]MBR6239440.1 murein biosynthesis integral membrane protein MurJ [Clostridia bacterium]
MEEKTSNGRLLKGTLVTIAVSVIAKIVAFITETILAGRLGTSFKSDAYYMVTSIQYVIYPMLSVGIWKIFLPIYKEKTTLGNIEDANKLTDKVITSFSIVSIVLVAVLMIFSNGVVSVVAPGFNRETKDLCALLVKISAPMYIFIMVAAVYASMLQCHNKFLGSQIREVASHIPTIIAALLFFSDHGIVSLAVALALGGLFRLLIELPFVDWGYRFRPSFGKNHDFIIMMKRLPSALVSEGVNQINMLVDKMMASTLPAGAVSGLNYGNRLTNVFSGLLSTAVSTALYPQVVELISLKKNSELNSLLSRIIRIFTLLMVPLTVACILFRSEIVSVVFERGAFGKESVILTSGTFACYSVGLFFAAVNTIIINVFYAYGDTRTPMLISIMNLIINAGFNLLLMDMIGVNGLAISTSITSLIGFLICMKRIDGNIHFSWKDLLKQFAVILAASVIACGLARIVTDHISMNKYIELALAVLTGVSVYAAELKLLKIEELTLLADLIRKRIRNKDN